MRLALRWIAVLLVAVALVVLWLRFDSKPNSEAAGPRERADVAAPQDVSGVADGPPAVAEATGARAEAVVADAQPESPVAESKEDTASIRVRVVAKETGAPFVGELIAARPNDGSTWSTTTTKLSRGSLAQAPTTDAEGRAELTVLARREHTLFLTNAEQPTSLGTPALEPGDVHECVLEVPTQADLVFVGRVIDDQTRAPIPDAAVGSLTGRGQASVPPLDALHSDRDGYFEVRVKSWETKFVGVTARGYAWVAVGLVRGFESRANPFEISMSRAATAEVVVLVHDRPAIGAKVRLGADSHQLQRPRGALGPTYMAQVDPLWSATTDELGLARLEELPARVPLQLEVTYERVRHVPSEPIMFEPGEARRIDVRIQLGVAVRGRLETSAGEPVPDAELWRVVSEWPTPGFLSPHVDVFAKARTDAQGRFVFEGVGAGDWAIGPAARGWGESAARLAPLAQRVVVRGDEGALDLVLRTDRGLYIRGRVLGSDGSPTRSFVRASNTPLGLWVYANCDDEGRFELGPLVQADYNVVAGGLGGPGAASDELSVAAGTEGLVLQLARAGALTVRVAGGAGELEEAVVTVVGERAEFRVMRSTTREGVCHFDGVAHGVYVVSASTSDGRFAWRRGVEVTAEKATTEVELALALGAVIELHYGGPDKRCSCSLLSGGAVVDATDLERGTVGRLIGPAGTLEVHRRIGATTPPEVHVVTVAPGEKRVLVLGK